MCLFRKIYCLLSLQEKNCSSHSRHNNTKNTKNDLIDTGQRFLLHMVKNMVPVSSAKHGSKGPLALLICPEEENSHRISQSFKTIGIRETLIKRIEIPPNQSIVNLSIHSCKKKEISNHHTKRESHDRRES